MIEWYCLNMMIVLQRFVKKKKTFNCYPHNNFMLLIPIFVVLLIQFQDIKSSFQAKLERVSQL